MIKFTKKYFFNITSIILILLPYFILKTKLANHFAIETLLIIILNSFSLNKFTKIISILLCLCNSLQFTNASFVGGYIEALTLENLDCAKDIGIFNIIKLTIIFLVYFYLLLKSKINLTKNKKQYILTFFVSFLIIYSSKKFPTNALFKTIKVATKGFFYKIEYSQGNQFKKETILDKGTSFNDKSLKNNNLIILFTEGTSLRVISKDLTPNAFALKNKSIIFDNYYNHTAATFRGIRGQLISGIQYLGGYYPGKNGFGQISQKELKEILKYKPEGIPSILKDKGYYTVFVSPHADTHFNNYIKEIGGFDKISHLGTNDNPDKENLTDKELYEKIFKEYEIASKQNKPFLIVSYILGTHEGKDSPDKKYKDGKNPYLNKFHNQDFWFGKFFEKYNKSAKAKDTILVYTTDHCTHSSTGYNKTFNYPDIDWIDTIPLFIYKPQFKHQIIDADGLTSITLAPTLLDMLGIHKVTNHFLGHSLFETGKHDTIEYQRFLGESCSDTKTKKDLNFKKDCQPAEKFYIYAG